MMIYGGGGDDDILQYYVTFIYYQLISFIYNISGHFSGSLRIAINSFFSLIT